MKKIVINTCYGGFGLSNIACKRYLELKGKKAYFFTHDFSNYSLDNLIPTTVDSNEMFVLVYTIPNPMEYLRKDKPWHTMTDKEKEKNNARYDKVSFNTNDLRRDDPILIKVIEELGTKANTKYSELKIISIPNNVKWEIEEYDGQEWVSEKHKIWK